MTVERREGSGGEEREEALRLAKASGYRAGSFYELIEEGVDAQTDEPSQGLLRLIALAREGYVKATPYEEAHPKELK